MTTILLPIKNLGAAKQRQALLSQEERSRLAWTMLKDVTRALNESRAAERIFVITGDAQVAEHARRQSWEILEEERQVSESHSVDAASRLLLEKGISSVLRLPGDIPLLKAHGRRFSAGKRDRESGCPDCPLAGWFRYQRTLAIAARRFSLVFRSRQLCAAPGGGSTDWDLPGGGRKRKAVI